MNSPVADANKNSQNAPVKTSAGGTKTTGSRQAEPPALSPIDREFIEIFVRFVTILGLPRSVGEIYGLLYASPRPLPFDRIAKKLGISTGSTSKGLRLLRQLGAVRVIYKPGDRRDHYTAEIAIKMLAIGFLREKVEPHLVASFQNLESLNEAFVRCSPLHQEFYRQRIDLLIDTHHEAREFLPFVYQSLE